MKRPPTAVEAVLVPITSVYAAVTRARNIMFDRGARKSTKISKPLISIGNLTAGGTGKTPITAFLVEQLEKKNLRVGIVSRGYGGKEKGPIAVPKDGKPESALRFGDEPAWLAWRFPSAAVVVGSSRVLACEELVRKNEVDLIIADDAFQHRMLRRDLDIVLIDATEPRWHYRSLPLGRMREDFKSLDRAHVVFLTKTNLAAPSGLDWLREKCRAANPRLLISEFESRITTLTSLDGVLSITPDSLRDKKVLLVSAIGRPEAFRELYEREAGTKCAHHLVFPDHHAYTQADCARMDEEARKFAADAVVVTEKDAVKLAGRYEFTKPVWVTKLEMRPKEELTKLYEIVDRLLL